MWLCNLFKSDNESSGSKRSVSTVKPLSRSITIVTVAAERKGNDCDPIDLEKYFQPGSHELGALVHELTQNYPHFYSFREGSSLQEAIKSFFEPKLKGAQLLPSAASGTRCFLVILFTLSATKKIATNNPDEFHKIIRCAIDVDILCNMSGLNKRLGEIWNQSQHLKKDAFRPISKGDKSRWVLFHCLQLSIGNDLKTLYLSDTPTYAANNLQRSKMCKRLDVRHYNPNFNPQIIHTHTASFTPTP